MRFVFIFKGEFPIEELVKQMDYYIVGNSHDERPYLFAALRNNVEVIGTMTDIEDIFNGITIPAELAQFKNQMHLEICKNFFEKFPPHEYEYIVFQQGLGEESLAFFFWIKEYRKHINKKILIISSGKLHVELMTICPYVDGVIQINIATLSFMYIYFSEIYNIKNYTELWDSQNYIKENSALNIQNRCKKAYSGDVARAFFGLNPELKFERYPVKIPTDVVNCVNNFFNQTGFKRGKTVFIATNGYWFPTALNDHYNFWIKLVKVLKNSGYNVVTNGQKESIPGIRNIFLSLTETASFIGICGNVVSVNTGFMEASCTLNNTDKIKSVFLYPNKNDFPLKKRITSSTFNEIRWFYEFQYRGSKMAEMRKNSYKAFLEKFFDSNINVSVYSLGLNEKEDDELIGQIIEDLES